MTRKSIFIMAAVFLFALTACSPFHHGLGGGGCENPSIENVVSMTGR